MAVFRVEKTKDYTVMSNYHLRDKNLSLKAKGLLSWMLANDENWDYSVAGIVKVMKENRDAINSALCELEDYGYLTRQQVRGNNGQFTEVEYLITEKPFTENPLSVNPQQINTNINKVLNKEKPLPKGKEEQAPSTPKKSYTEVFNAPENEHIKEALVRFINICKGRNIKFQYKTLERWAKTLRDNAGTDKELAMAIVEQSIDKGWKDLYPLKNTNKNAYVKKEAVSIPVSKEDKATNEDGSYTVF